MNLNSGKTTFILYDLIKNPKINKKLFQIPNAS